MNKLSQIMRLKNLSQAEVCRLTGYSSGTVSKHCSAKSIPAEAAIVYSAKLKIPLIDLRPDLPPPFLQE